MLRKFFSYYRPHRRLFLLDFGSAVLLAILELMFPLATTWIIDDLVERGEWEWILWAGIGLVVLYLASTGLQFIVVYFGHKLGINIETDMRQQLYNHLQKLSFRFFDNTKTGHLMSRLTADLFDIGELAHHGPEDFFIVAMTFIGSFSIMAYLNLPLALITLVAVPVIIWLIAVCNIKMEKAFSSMYASIADVNAQVEDSVAGIRVVQSFTNEEHEKAKFAKNNGKFRMAKLRSYFVMGYATATTHLLMRMMSLIVLLFGAWFVVKGTLTYGELVGFLLIVNIFVKPIEKINFLLEMYPKGMAGFKRFQELLAIEPDVADAPDAVAAGPFKGDIEFRNVTFGYDDHERVLKNIDLSIRAGETVAFVGPSGAGKTTLVSLIPRFYDIDEGEIRVDGTDIRKYTLRSLRSQIGIVQQDVYLFAGTIRENIAYGKLDATDEEIWDAVHRAHLAEFVAGLPDGLETEIGERGVKLSGGQKQRLAIARMFLKNPPILILDEATSALDTETEAAIQAALDELSVGRTTLVIAHRLATIRNADRIVVVTEDGIAEQGSHDELMQRGGAYARLNAAQLV